MCEGYVDSDCEGLEPRPQNAQSIKDLPKPDLSNLSAFLDETDMAGPFVAFLESTAPRMATIFASMLESFLDDKLMVLHLADKAQYLWKTLIPRASKHDQTTRYAAVALSSLHQSLESSQTFPWQNESFARYYNRAVGLVNERQCSILHGKLLLPCILFAHCELLMGNSNDAMAHISSGKRIMSGLQTTGESLPDVNAEVIVAVLNAFVAKSQLSGSGNRNFYFPTTLRALVQEMAVIPEPFSSLANAAGSLLDVLHRALLLQELGQPCDQDLAIATRKSANNWSVSFDVFRFAFGMSPPEVKRWHLLLLAEHRMVQLLLKSMPPEADSTLQRATGDFRIMIAQLKTFLTGQDKESGTVLETSRHVPVSLGFIMPLFFICVHCRDHEIQLAALELLRELNVTEGHWNSCLAHAIASKIIELDEKEMQRISSSKLSETVTGRVKPTSLELFTGGRLLLQYVKSNSDGKAGEPGAALLEQKLCQEVVTPSWVSTTHTIFGGEELT